LLFGCKVTREVIGEKKEGGSNPEGSGNSERSLSNNTQKGEKDSSGLDSLGRRAKKKKRKQVTSCTKDTARPRNTDLCPLQGRGSVITDCPPYKSGRKGLRGAAHEAAGGPGEKQFAKNQGPRAEEKPGTNTSKLGEAACGVGGVENRWLEPNRGERGRE